MNPMASHCVRGPIKNTPSFFEQSKIGDFTPENQLIDMSQIAVLSGSLVVVAALIYEGMQFKGMKMMLLHRTNLYIIAVFRSLTSKEVCQSNCPGKPFQQYIKVFWNSWHLVTFYKFRSILHDSRRHILWQFEV